MSEELDKTAIREELDLQLDKMLLDALQNGAVVLNKDGVSLQITAPHQLFEITRKRLADLGFTKEVRPGDIANRLAEQYSNDPKVMEMHGVPEHMPPVSSDPDTATA